MSTKISQGNEIQELSAPSASSPLNALAGELSGRELDAVIDKRLFECGGAIDVMWENGEPLRLSVAADPSKWVVPHYSSDIAAAHDVLDKFTEWAAWKLGEDDLAGHYQVEVTHDCGVFMACADTLPEAICRAALAAVEPITIKEAGLRHVNLPQG